MCDEPEQCGVQRSEVFLEEYTPFHMLRTTSRMVVSRDDVYDV